MCVYVPQTLLNVWRKFIHSCKKKKYLRSKIPLVMERGDVAKSTDISV